MSSQLQNSVGIFVSYSHSDRFIADVLAQRLREVGYFPWVDFKSIVGGDDWKGEIENALKQSIAILVLLTPESVNSQWVRYECERAQQNGLSLIPLMFRQCQLPNIIEAYQYIDFQQGIDLAFKDLQRALLAAAMRARADQIPIMETTLEVAKPTPDTQAKPLTKEPQTTPKSLALIIEDMTAYQEMLQEILSDMGLEVHIAGTRNEVMNLIRSHQYAFITLDMQLGPEDEKGQEGVFLLQRLRRYQEDAPIVIITSLEWGKRQTREFFVKYHIVDMLDKPFDHKELEMLVKKHVKEITP